MNASKILIIFCALANFYCASVPQGEVGPAAENLAQKMLKAADNEAWQKTAAVAFVFRGGDRIFWDRKRKLVEVAFKNNTVQFGEVTGKSVCLLEMRRVFEGCDELTTTAVKRFYNHTFWLNPAFHIYSPGSERALVVDAGATGPAREKLLVRFRSGGATPGDRYVFTLDEEGKIVNMQMWVSLRIVPDGANAKFANYHRTETGVRIALEHKVMAISSVDLSDVHMYAVYPEKSGVDRFALLMPSAGVQYDSLNRRTN